VLSRSPTALCFKLQYVRGRLAFCSEHPREEHQAPWGLSDARGWWGREGGLRWSCAWDTSLPGRQSPGGLLGEKKILPNMPKHPTAMLHGAPKPLSLLPYQHRQIGKKSILKNRKPETL
jgi:hypothetical protein